MINKIEYFCKFCKKNFMDYKSNYRIFCSKECMYKNPKPKRTLTYEQKMKISLANKGKLSPLKGTKRIKLRICQYCNKGFYPYYNNKPMKFCSNRCYGLSKRKRIIKKCLFCNDSFETWPCIVKIGEGKFCSQKCQIKSMRDIAKLAHIKVKCQICNKEFDTIKSILLKGKGKFCSRGCFTKYSRENIIGEKHHNWNGGSSFAPYPLGWTKTFKEQIRQRDNYKCQICGKPEIENIHKLNVHHIDYDKNNLNLQNLISLCHSCHTKTNHHRDYYQKYIKEKLDKTEENLAQILKEIRSLK